jgi:hypothetical protein
VDRAGAHDCGTPFLTSAMLTGGTRDVRPPSARGAGLRGRSPGR